ncbi:MAG TPA: hypothetical protein VMT18_11490 [Planctomycetota bacterium]|nr:hypothetical protein [Planctomycetota bacterium]
MPPHLHLALALTALCACAAPAASTTALEDPAAPQAERAPVPCALDGAGVHYVAGADPTRPFVRYADGQVGLADHCAIRLASKLNRRIPPVYVNGRPIGFC